MYVRIPWFIIVVIGLVACTSSSEQPRSPDEQIITDAPLDERAIVDAAWEALEPNTSSHSRANWEVQEARQARGREVQDQFDDKPAPGCLGPTPPDNETINPDTTYGYVRFVRRPATRLPATPLSPTAPPLVPEPFMYEARFLLDVSDGHVVARKLLCVIY